MKKKTLNEKKGWWVPHTNPIPNSKKISILFKENRASLGRETFRLENILKKKLNVKYIVLTNSGTSALYMATMLANIQKRKNIYSPAINWPGSINGALFAGKKLNLIDSKNNYINGDYTSIQKKLKKTDLVYLTHLNGKCAYKSDFVKIWKKKKFFVIEDAAQSFMVKDHNKKFVGTQFDVGCFSLGMSKICNMIYGGFCATNRLSYAKELQKFRNNGVDNEYQKPNGIGGNFKPSDVHAVVGIDSVNSFLKIKKKLFQIYNIYKKKLNNKNFKIFEYDITKGEIPNYIEVLVKKRVKFITYLNNNNISFSYGTRMLSLSHRYSKFGKISNAKKFDKEIIRLPCGPGYSIQKIKKQIEIINNFN